MIDRLMEKQILRRLADSKVLLLHGGRQVGKTTVMRKLFHDRAGVLWLNGDEPHTRRMFESNDADTYRTRMQNHSIIIIDEAQRIEDIGYKLKLVHDTIPSVRILVTGSSCFHLSSSIFEALAGRRWEMHLKTLSFEELSLRHGRQDEISRLSERLVYGCYPEIATCQAGDEQPLLVQLSESMLSEELCRHDDHFSYEKIRKLMRILAQCPGGEYSGEMLCESTGIEREEIEEVLVQLEQSHIIFSLDSYTGKLWNEKKDEKKYYFVDNGLRNAMLLHFGSVAERSDAPVLWENYLISERLKYLTCHSIMVNSYFWMTHYDQNLTYLEESSGHLHAYEFLWSSALAADIPHAFRRGYPEAEITIITPRNYDQFLCGEI